MSGQQERAAVRVVTGGGEEESPVVQPRDPDALSPIEQGVVQPPPQELEKDLGGEAFQSPTPEQLVEGTGGSLADKMRARFEGMSATEEFGVPGWELPNGEPGLIVEVRAFGDRKAFNAGISNEAFIARSTRKLFFVDDKGEREEIPGKWGPALAEIIGVKAQKATDLVAMVISKPDPDHKGQRIPNVAGIGALATMIISWSARVTQDAEELLGG